MSTQRILAKLYEYVIEKLELTLIDFNIIFEKEKEVLIRFADKLEFDVTDSQSQQDRNHTARIALMPVVQKCVISILRELIKICKEYREPQIEISAHRLFDHICARCFRLGNISTICRARKKNKAALAVEITAQALLETNLFRSPVTLTMDGEEYEICHFGDGFYIRRNDSH